MSRKVRKRTFGHAHPAKIQVNLRIDAVRSEISMAIYWIPKAAKFLHPDSED